MKIEETHIVEEGTSGNSVHGFIRRFRKVYISNGRYFIQAPQGAISEISKEEFELLDSKTKENK